MLLPWTGWADEQYPGDGVDFPENMVVYSISEFNVPWGSGVYYNPQVGARPIAWLNMFSRCSHPQNISQCLNHYTAWPTCVLVQKNPINLATPSRVALAIDALQTSYFPNTSHPDEVRFEPTIEVRVDFEIKNGDTWEQQSRQHNIPAVQWRRAYMYPNEDSIAVWSSDGRDYKLDLGSLQEMEFLSPVKNFKISLCNLAAGDLDLYKLEIITQSLSNP